MALFSRFFKARDRPVKNYLPSSNYSFFFGSTTSGKTVNVRTAMQTTAVYACVRILAETIASLPLHTYAATGQVGFRATQRVDGKLILAEQNSFDAQVQYYSQYIQKNADWEFIEVYSDEGISATSTKNRAGFNRMMVDAVAGKMDLILTKSVSRFARNTVDTLVNVRLLKENGVEIYFEKENIYSFDSKGELMLTIISSLAQTESYNISSNVVWGKRKSFADGVVSLPYKRFLGYEKGNDGLPQIVEAQAKIVRLIYKLFLEGYTTSGIARHLTQQGIPTPSGKVIWSSTTLDSMLSNEKYKGDAILQKSYTIDYLTKKSKRTRAKYLPTMFKTVTRRSSRHPGVSCRGRAKIGKR